MAELAAELVAAETEIELLKALVENLNTEIAILRRRNEIQLDAWKKRNADANKYLDRALTAEAQNQEREKYISDLHERWGVSEKDHFRKSKQD